MKIIGRIIIGLLAGGLMVWITSWAFGPAAPLEVVSPGERIDPQGIYNPVTAGEPLPDGFRQLLPRDGIPPIYNPQFAPAADVDWPGATQVIGVAADGQAKAYPVSILNRHEMVNDFIAGDPILVTW